MKKFFLVCCLLLIALCCSLAHAGEVERFKLDNGLTVLLKENHETKVVAVQVWVKAGSAYEKPGEEGITHLLEHMMFKGSAAHPAGELSNLVEGYGGEVNAYTTTDHTNYHLQAASMHAPELVELMADAIINAAISREELALEKEVVLEEMRRQNDNPESRLALKLMEVGYGANHPFGKPVIGTKASVSAIVREDIMNYRQRLYRGPNMVLVVTGDFDSNALKPIIIKAFTPLPAGRVEALSLPPAASAGKPQLFIMREAVSQATISLVWPAAGLPSDDVFPLDAAAAIMGDGLTSRLFWQLKEHLRLVDEVGAYAYTPLGPGLFAMQATMEPGQVASAWQPMLSEAYGLLRQPAQNQELSRIRANISAEFVRGNQTMDGMAEKLGYFELLRGGYENAAHYLDRFRQVNSALISSTMQKYLNPQQLKMVIQLPEGADAPSQAQVEALARKVWEQANTPRPADSRLVRTLGNGLTLIVVPRHSVPLVSMALAVPHGLAAEKPQQAGINQLWASCITSGNQQYSYGQMAHILESRAATMQGFANRSNMGLSASFLSDDWQEGLGLLATAWQTPTFLPADLGRAKEEQMAGLRAQQDAPTYPIMAAARALLYPDHPYGREPLGSNASIQAITGQELQTLHQNLRRTQGAVLVLVGDIDPAEAQAHVEQLWAKEPALTLGADNQPVGPAPASQEKNLAAGERQQTQIMVGFRAPGADSHDKYATIMLQTILDGMGGRLFMELREKQSLAYTVFSFYNMNLNSGTFAIYIACDPSKQKAALTGIAQQLDLLRNVPVSELELARAKNYFLGTEAVAQQTYNIQAITMARDYLMGLGIDHQTKMAEYINGITPQQIMEAAQKIFDLNHQLTVRYGPAAP